MINKFEEYKNESLLSQIETALATIQDETIKKEIQEFVENDGKTKLVGVLNYLDYNHVFIVSKYCHNSYEWFYLANNRIINQKRIEKREKGIIYTEIEKRFEPSSSFKNQSVLTSLRENRYVYNNTKILKNIMQTYGNNSWFNGLWYKLFLEIGIIKDQCNYLSTFSCDMIYHYVLLGLNWTMDNNYLTKTYINGKDVSSLFTIDGPDKIYRIYDLYHGLINGRNINDLKKINLGLISPDIYDYKTLLGITSKENIIAGQPLEEANDLYYSYLKKIFKKKFNYLGPIKLNREFILNIINSNVQAEKDNNKYEKVLKHILK